MKNGVSELPLFIRARGVWLSKVSFLLLASGEIPGMKVYEDEQTFAFMDIAKDVDGHILVIPKRHFKNVLDCDDETLCSV